MSDMLSSIVVCREQSAKGHAACCRSDGLPAVAIVIDQENSGVLRKIILPSCNL
ncbi:hypothetical protein [Burkholderia sp. S-53]|uniref:hypothetical protein n=1 Tax=Burkholderia sp. S-53 TaxID=2906514 RepID=UPI0021D1DC6C|nr:hypothetical protein [Burkholderia sp. S-53]UXU91736.1 hypothetical protein LXM88_26595 [Burkholderia sp. S-53]